MPKISQITINTLRKCMEEIRHDDLRVFVETHGGNFSVMLRTLRRCHYNQFTWTLYEIHNHIRIEITSGDLSDES